MLVMPWSVYLTLDRIPKNVKAWRDEALRKGWLVEFDPHTMIAGYISHTWWDRNFKDADQIAEAERRVKEGERPNPYDKGAPDWQQDLYVHPVDPNLPPPRKNLRQRHSDTGAP